MALAEELADYEDEEGLWDEQAVNDSLYADEVEKPLVSTSSKGNPFAMPWYFALIYIVLYVALLIVAAVGNCCVVYIIAKSNSMRTATHFFIVSLSTADTLLATFNGLFMTIYLMESNWMFGSSYCRIAQFLAPFLISVSIFTYTAMALDRYVAIVYPLRKKPSTKLVSLTLLGIWTVATAIATPNFAFATLMSPGGGRIVCVVDWPDGLRSTSDKIYNLFLICVNYILPLFIMTFAYSRICIVLWGSKVVGEWNRQQAECVKAKRKLVKMLIVCVTIFAICWAPMHTFQITIYIKESVLKWRYSNYLYVIIYLIAMSNTMYPPIIYCQLNVKFRYGFINILRRICCRAPLVQVDKSVGSSTRYRIARKPPARVLQATTGIPALISATTAVSGHTDLSDLTQNGSSALDKAAECNGLDSSKRLSEHRTALQTDNYSTPSEIHERKSVRGVYKESF